MPLLLINSTLCVCCFCSSSCQSSAELLTADLICRLTWQFTLFSGSIHLNFVFYFIIFICYYFFCCVCPSPTHPSLFSKWNVARRPVIRQLWSYIALRFALTRKGQKWAVTAGKKEKRREEKKWEVSERWWGIDTACRVSPNKWWGRLKPLCSCKCERTYGWMTHKSDGVVEKLKADTTTVSDVNGVAQGKLMQCNPEVQRLWDQHGNKLFSSNASATMTSKRWFHQMTMCSKILTVKLFYF